MSAEQLTPITEIHQQSERLRVNLPFPSWVEAENIGVNLPKTETLMNLGGIKHLRLVGNTNGERAAVMPMAVGINPDGSSSAGMGVAKESTKLFTYDVDGGAGTDPFRNLEWASVGIKINLEEVQRKIDEKRGDLRKAESWAPHIDAVLKKGIRQSGTRHLLTNHTNGQKLFLFLTSVQLSLLHPFNLSIYDIAFRLTPRIPNIGEFVLDVSLNAFFWAASESIRGGRENRNGSGYRLSIFPGFEVDRAAALQILSRTGKLISPVRSRTGK